MAEIKNFMDFKNLKSYDEKLKKLIKEKDEAVLSQIENTYLKKSALSWNELEAENK